MVQADIRKAVVITNIFSKYQGAEEVPSRSTAPLLALDPAVAVANATEYPGLTLIGGNDINNAVCQ